MERKLSISAFRNLGFENGKPSKEGLVLNHSLKKGSLGDLVILIGANNSGKSNVLDALIAYKNKRLFDRDVTDIYMDEDCRKPSVKLVCNDENVQYGNRIFKDGGMCVFYPGQEEPFSPDIVYDFNAKGVVLNELNRIKNRENNYVADGYRKLSGLIDRASLTDESSKKEFDSLVLKIAKTFIEYLQDKTGNYSSFIAYVDMNMPILYNIKSEYSTYKKKLNEKNTLNALNAVYLKEYGYNFEPTIYEYAQENISSGNLETTYGSLNNSSFIKAVLKAIDIDPTILINAHNDAMRLRNMGLLKTTERKLNKALDKVSKRFNKLYYLDDAKYSFEFVLESERVFFTLYKGEQAISLDYQSTGFRWFFDLYFNLFSSSTLKPGDIVIMDEPATNLHVKGQIELRAFLKEFAMKNDITIVIATHSPFLIDLDFLDELRIVSNKNNVSSIDNDFSAINIDDPDSLLPVKESLTVENHVLIDPDQNVVFVEGITDYNYLVGMKKVLGIENITFLPIKGLGKKGQEKEISEKLIRIRKHNPFLLADADGAGKAFKNANKDSELKVVILSDVDENFKEIESLFAPEDAKKFGLVDEKGKAVKHNSTSASFKNRVINDPNSVSKQTKNNFAKLFELIID